jgi:hypothetical protein
MSTQAAIHRHSVQRLLTMTEAEAEAEVQGLAELLIDSVESGASVSFMHPLPKPKAVDFWRCVADGATSAGLWSAAMNLEVVDERA